MKGVNSIIFFTLLPLLLYSQDRNSIWCFGDSAGIDFRIINNPVHFTTIMDGRGSCVSIADSATGSLLFYAFTRATIIGNTTQIITSNDSLMQNGGNIVGQGWYRELVIITDPAHSNQYYLFSVGVTNSGQEGLYYSRIDMTQNAGLGSVIQKNIQLLPYDMQDGIQAVKHGNGRDWWVICHRWDVDTNEFDKYLVTPNGVFGPYIQTIGAISTGGFLNINFSQSGTKVAVVDYNGLFEIFNFDRCTGDFSSIPFFTFPTSSPAYDYLWNCEFSPDETKLYISEGQQIAYLLQLNLLDSNPWLTSDTIWTQSAVQYAEGQLELAPDEKIYLSTSYYDGLHFPYPYTDSTYFLENMNLSVINSPNNLGSACDFQPYSFYLGGHRSYNGLPNNPNYDLPADTASLCDSLSVGISQTKINSKELNVFYHSGWQIVFINAMGLTGKNYSLEVYDLMGREIFAEEGKLSSEYFTRDLSCSGFSKGMYIVNLQTEKEKLVKRFLKE